jgi:hypothetical protein
LSGSAPAPPAATEPHEANGNGARLRSPTGAEIRADDLAAIIELQGYGREDSARGLDRGADALGWQRKIGAVPPAST